MQEHDLPVPSPSQPRMITISVHLADHRTSLPDLGLGLVDHSPWGRSPHFHHIFSRDKKIPGGLPHCPGPEQGIELGF